MVRNSGWGSKPCSIHSLALIANINGNINNNISELWDTCLHMSAPAVPLQNSSLNNYPISLPHEDEITPRLSKADAFSYQDAETCQNISWKPKLPNHAVLNCQNLRFGVFWQQAVLLRGSADDCLDHCAGAVVVPVDQTHFGWATRGDQVRRSTLTLRAAWIRDTPTNCYNSTL
jgi:hypothetical protein